MAEHESFQKRNNEETEKHMTSTVFAKRKMRYTLGFLLLAALCLTFFILNICVGSVGISLADVGSVLFGGVRETVFADIILQIRLPRTFAALLLGGALALAGYMLQTFFHNPIAGPFVLGISSGAKMVVALVMVFALSLGWKMNSALLIIAAFLGAMLSMAFVLVLSNAVSKMSMLIVAGVMIGYICSAVTDLVVTFAEDSNIVNLHNWSLGSFSGISWENVRVIFIVVLVCFAIVFSMAKQIEAYSLGEAYAQNLGVNIRHFRFALVLLSSVLAATVAAFAGPISFVGVAVPHLVKSLLKTTKPILMIPATFFGGAIFCMACDLISRTMFAPTELSVSTITAVFGAPVVILIMLRKER